MKPTHYIILALLLIIGVLWFTQPEPNQPDYSQYEARIEARDTVIHTLSREAEKEKQRRQSDSVQFVKTIQAYKDRDKNLTREIARIKASKVVVQVRDSVPEIDTLLNHYDSLLQSKDEQIELQAQYIETLQVDISKVTDNFMERMKLQSETIEDQKLIIEDQRKELRKERRSKKIAKILVPVVAVGAFLLGGAF